MITYQVKKDTEDVSVDIRIIDSADGTPETGVLYDTEGIDLEYRREGAVSVDITEAELTTPALDDAHEDGGFLHIGNGYYRLDLPDAACATGSSGVLVYGTVTGMVVIGCYVQLVDNLPSDVITLIGAAGVGLTEAGGDGDHLTEAGGDGDHLTEAGGDGDHLTAINLPNQTMDITGDITGNLSGSVGSVTGAVGSVTGAVGSVTAEVSADVTKISGDATAADILKLFAAILNQSTGQLDNGSYDATIDTYQSKTTIIDDDTGSADRYITIWFKNGEPITSGITSPTIQVIKIADATDLVASDDMTEVGALGLYRYDEAGNRIVAGAGYIAKTQATIGGATRTWLQPIGRDS